MVTKYDKILLVTVLLAAVVLYWVNSPPAREPGEQVIVEVDGEVVSTFTLASLDSGQLMPVAGPLGDSVVEKGEEQVRMASSPCPDQICVHVGWVSRVGQMIVCLPNRVVVRIQGDTESGVDGVVQ